MKSKLTPPETKRLKLKCDELVSTSAFKFNLRRYSGAAALPLPLPPPPRSAAAATAGAGDRVYVAAASGGVDGANGVKRRRLVDPTTCCLPRHRMPSKSIDEGSNACR